MSKLADFHKAKARRQAAAKVHNLADYEEEDEDYSEGEYDYDDPWLVQEEVDDDEIDEDEYGPNHPDWMGDESSRPSRPAAAAGPSNGGAGTGALVHHPPAKRRKKAADDHRGRQLARWHLTKNGVSEEDTERVQFEDNLRKYAKHYCFQLERAPTTGTLHYQVRLSLKTKTYFGQVQKMFPGCHVSPESTVAGDTDLGPLYAMKDDTRVSGPWTDKDVKQYIDPQYDIASHYLPWQEECKRRLIGQNKRQVLVVVDPVGNSGKTCFAHHIVLFKVCGNEGRFVPPFCNTPDEIMQFVHSIIEPQGDYTIVVDLPRTGVLTRMARQMFGALETLKGGYCYDKRYSGKYKYFKPPKMLVFCNDVPDKGLLTGDRWDILTLPWPAQEVPPEPNAAEAVPPPNQLQMMDDPDIWNMFEDMYPSPGRSTTPERGK